MCLFITAYMSNCGQIKEGGDGFVFRLKIKETSIHKGDRMTVTIEQQNNEICRLVILELWMTGDFSSLDKTSNVGSSPKIYPDHRHIYREHIKEFRDAFPDIGIEFVVILADKNHVAGKMIIRGVHCGGTFRNIPISGRSIEITGTFFFRIEGGEVFEHIVHIDTDELIYQLTHKA